MPLPDVVSGLLLSERPRVRIAPGTPKSPIKSNFFGLLLSTAHRGAEVQGKTAACYAYKLCVARLKLIAAPHKIAQERWSLSYHIADITVSMLRSMLSGLTP